MLLEILLALILGLIAGTITGIIPGIHINLVAVLLLASSVLLLDQFSAFTLSVFIVSMAITHTFLDFIPSIFLGAPEEATALGVLPGHKMLMEGKGYEAVKLSIIGSYFGLILMIFAIPLILLVLPKTYSFIEIGIPYLLIAASSFLILKEKNKFWAFFIFILAGSLGIATLNLLVIKQPLFPLLTGLFGISILINSINQGAKIPSQKITHPNISKKSLAKTLSAGIISSSLCSFLPGLGASQAAVLGSQISGRLDQKRFIVLLGAISTIVIGLNFVAIYAIQKTRSGTAAVVNQLIHDMTLIRLSTLLTVMLVAGSLAVFISIAISKLFSKHITKFPYTKISLAIIIFLTIFSFFISGPYSLIVLVTSTALGVLTIKKEVRKMNLMGCLIIPVIIILL